ncbi:putative capsid protein [Stipagrostis associaed virus]|uniref:putative capsid protein n=1 Tax=Stipagrostis associaed virus TaxID=2282646 RepID=UPI000DF5D809|nr:putative capsid protein [Stipagrostis associaed virus]AXF50875.1 putative capsid protein [Stipagrostis associaed virus]
MPSTITRRNGVSSYRPRRMFGPIGLRAMAHMGDMALKRASRSYKSFGRRGKGSSMGKSNSKMDSAPLYGTTYTSKVSYRKRGVSRSRSKFGKRKFGKFLHQSMKLQNAQNTLAGNAFGLTTTAGSQAWSSLDLCNGVELYQILRTQLPPSASTATMRDFTMALKNFNLKWYITNVGTTNVEVEIYHIMPRRDVTCKEMSIATPSPSNGNIFANYVDSQYPSDALGDPDGDAVPTINSLGWTPFLNRNLMRQFIVKKVRTVKMAPADTYMERDSVGQKMLNASRLGLEIFSNGATTSYNDVQKWYLKGLSQIIFIKLRGFPNTTSGSPVSSINIAWEVTTTSKVIQTRTGSDALIGNA